MTKEVGTSDLLETWGSNGTIVEPSLAKKENGWDLGEQPPHEYANWVLNTLGQAINHILQNGIPAHSTTTEYETGDICQVAGVVYRAKQDNTNSVPPNNNWLKIAPFGVKNSIEEDEGSFQLVGDEAAPGNNKIYGTNGSGQRGWKDEPAQADGFNVGDIKWSMRNSALAGYVRANGLTIGSAASAATERANDDTEALYTLLWEEFNYDVSGGRGASAAADFAANKTMTLPDAKNRAIFALDGMGGTNTNRITNGTNFGQAGGAETHQLTEAEMPEHFHVQGEPMETGHDSTYLNGFTRKGVNTNNLVTVTGSYSPDNLHVNSDNAGEDEPHNNMPPYIILGTVYLKL